MPGVCANPWQTYDCEWGVRYLWRWIDWLARADIIVLALMLACVIVILSRGSYRYHLSSWQSRTFLRNAAGALHSGAFEEVSQHAEQNPRSPVAGMVVAWVAVVGSEPTEFTLAESIDVARRAFRRSQGKLTVDFIFGIGTLQSIAYTAPFLGLAGACLVILNAFSRGIDMEKHAATVMIASEIAAALLTTTMGLLVASAAAYSRNYLLERIEAVKSETSEKALQTVMQLIAHSEPHCTVEQFFIGPKWCDREKGGLFQFAQGLRLRKQFSQMPSYALLAAPSLAILLTVLMAFLSFYTPVGLSVRLLKVGALETSNSWSVKPLVVGVVETNGQSAVYVNSKKTPWEKLQTEVRTELNARSQPIAYVEAGNNVPWQTVANAIDVIESVPANVVLLTIAPKPNSTRRHHLVRQ